MGNTFKKCSIGASELQGREDGIPAGRSMPRSRQGSWEEFMSQHHGQSVKVNVLSARTQVVSTKSYTDGLTGAKRRVTKTETAEHMVAGMLGQANSDSCHYKTCPTSGAGSTSYDATEYRTSYDVPEYSAKGSLSSIEGLADKAKQWQNKDVDDMSVYDLEEMEGRDSAFSPISSDEANQEKEAQRHATESQKTRSDNTSHEESQPQREQPCKSTTGKTAHARDSDMRNLDAQFSALGQKEEAEKARKQKSLEDWDADPEAENERRAEQVACGFGFGNTKSGRDGHGSSSSSSSSGSDSDSSDSDSDSGDSDKETPAAIAQPFAAKKTPLVDPRKAARDARKSRRATRQERRATRLERRATRLEKDDKERSKEEKENPSAHPSVSVENASTTSRTEGQEKNTIANVTASCDTSSNIGHTSHDKIFTEESAVQGGADERGKAETNAQSEYEFGFRGVFEDVAPSAMRAAIARYINARARSFRSLNEIKYGKSVLMQALADGEVDVAKYIIVTAGSEKCKQWETFTHLNYREERSGNTCLTLALELAHPDVAALILRHPQFEMLNSRTKFGYTAYSISKSKNLAEITAQIQQHPAFKDGGVVTTSPHKAAGA